MIDNHKVLGVIVARGNSKGLPGKNTLDIGGKPMVAWSVEAAGRSGYLDRSILSSDDDKIIEAARRFGADAPFKRPPELATDAARVEDAVIHALDSLAEDYDYLVLLQATSPLRTGEDIDGALRTCVDAGAPACVSMTTPAKSPYLMFRVDERNRLRALLDTPAGRRRQDLPPAFVPNGAVYVARTDWFRENETFYTPETVAYEMPAERSIDVDTALDFKLVQAVIGGN